MNEVNALLAEDAFLVQELRRRYASLQTLVEAGVARVWYWINGGKPYGMISAEKHGPEFTTKINRSRSAKLSVELAKRKLSGILLRGYFKEETDTEPKPEIAYFVPLGTGYSGLDEPGFRNFLLGLGNRFNQQSILYSAGYGQPAQELEVPGGKILRSFSRLKFNPNAEDLQYAWSEVRRHKLVFLECAIGADTVHDRASEHYRGLLGGVHLNDLHKLKPVHFLKLA